MLKATASGKTAADKDGKWGTSMMGIGLPHGYPPRELTHIPPKGTKDHRFSQARRGYVSSQEGNGDTVERSITERKQSQ